MLRSPTLKLSTGLIKTYQRCATTTSSASTLEKISEDVQDPNSNELKATKKSAPSAKVQLDPKISNNTGKSHLDPDRFMRICALGVNILDQIYYPLEHVAWAADSKLLSINSEPWWYASSICWALSMYLMVMKSLRYFLLLRNLKNLIRPGNLSSGEMISRRLSDAQWMELLTALRCSLDFVQAIHWLPSGMLWAGKLCQWQIGALGFASSILSIIQSSG